MTPSSISVTLSSELGKHTRSHDGTDGTSVIYQLTKNR